MKKYELTNESINWKGHKLYRIKATRNFNDVKAGDLGGFVENEFNLSHDGNCWIYNEGKVYGESEVFNNAKVYDWAEVMSCSRLCDDAEMHDCTEICNFAELYGTIKLYDFAKAKHITINSGRVYKNNTELIDGVGIVYC